MKHTKNRWMSVTCALLLMLSAILPTEGRADMSFSNITNNEGPDLSSQLAVQIADTTDVGGTYNQVTFTFMNLDPYPDSDAELESSITEIYFNDGTLLGIASIVPSSGVNFEPGADPGNLPGGELLDPDFLATAAFSTQAAKNTADGINPGEQLGIEFSLLSGLDIDDVWAALGDGSLRIGMHVSGIEGGDSDSYLYTAPLPGAVLLGFLGLGVAGLKLRRHA